MISLAVVEGKDDLCPNHVTGLDASDRMRCYSWYRMRCKNRLLENRLFDDPQASEVTSGGWGRSGEEEVVV